MHIALRHQLHPIIRTRGAAVFGWLLLLLLVSSASPCRAGQDQPLLPAAPQFHNHPFNLVLQGRNVLSVVGDSFVYELGNETIVITSSDPLVREFLAAVKEGQRNRKLAIRLIPEQTSLYNARFQALLQHHAMHNVH